MITKTKLRIGPFICIGLLLGVRRLDAALLSITLDQYESGVKPPHSKEMPATKV
jgi:hypothetical protein